MADVEKARELIQESLDVRGSYLENVSKVLDKTVRVHENGASFYEKLILFDVGTIALSLTLLGQLVAHTPGGHVPRHPFLWFLCPAWVLLLVSIQCCAQLILGFHNVNTALVAQMSKLVSDNQANYLRVLITRLSAMIGEVALSKEQAQQLRFSTSPQANPEQKAQTLSEVFANMNEALVKALQDSSGVNQLLLKLEKDSKKTAAGRISIGAVTLALVLICIFAIESILQM